MEYSIVENNVVTNVVVSNTPLAANWHAGNHGIGAIYTPATDSFALPVVPVVPAPPVTTLSKLEFFDRFTDTEQVAIYDAAKLVTQVQIWLDKFKLALDIDVTDPRTIAGIQALEAVGLLAAGRAAEILV